MGPQVDVILSFRTATISTAPPLYLPCEEQTIPFHIRMAQRMLFAKCWNFKLKQPKSDDFRFHFHQKQIKKSINLI